MPTRSYVNTDYGASTKPVNVPDPVSAQDVSTRHFLLTQAATVAAMPAPVTSGSGIQTFTDVMGDIWIAANGVRNGNWYRARDVLHSRVYLNIATNLSTTPTLLTYDSASRDPYSLYNTTTGVFTSPVAALFLVTTVIKYTAQANNDYCIINFQVNGTTVANRSDVTAARQAAEQQSGFLTDRVYLNVGDTFRIVTQSNNALVITTGSISTFLDIDFAGQG
jgi:hypothetical protein